MIPLACNVDELQLVVMGVIGAALLTVVKGRYEMGGLAHLVVSTQIPEGYPED